MAFSISSVAFMPIWGLSNAVGILVGQHFGENRDELAARVRPTPACRWPGATWP